MNSETLPSSLRVLLRRLWRHLDARRRRQIGALCVLILVSGFCEILTLGAVLPFLGVLAAPEQAIRHPIGARVAAIWGATTADQLVFPLAVLFAVAAMLAGGVRLWLLWVNDRLAYAISGDFAAEIYRRTMYQPYTIHVRRHSSVVLSGVTQKIEGALKMLMAQLTLVASAVQMLALTSALVAVNPVVAGVASGVLGSGYGALTWASRRRLRRNSQLIAREQTSLIRVVQEGLGGIRDVLLESAQQLYADKYRRANYAVRRAQSINNFIMNGPRFVLEALGIALVAALAYWMSRGSGGLGAALPVLGVLALGAQRMLPLVQMAYASWSSMTANVAGVSEVLDLLDQPLPPEANQPPPAPLGLHEGIRVESVRFRYANGAPWVLDGLTLSISKGVRMGVTGETGSGKSTLSDLLMGLLEPTEGAILVDGQPLTRDRLRRWQRSIAHVPQSIFLSDSSVAENIAFGIHPRDVDMDRVEQAARQAQISAFVEDLPDGYRTTVGERGVRLSGGQRQRIGIARALYRRAPVLVLDEATSALDDATELAVMETLEALDEELTIIVIAHRLTSLRRCDRLIELVGGRAVAYQSYQEMIETSACARKIAAVS
ncbi:MAG: ABC transporter ATP-binding protein [Acidobacteria bacterium RIFCSPLOWO2_02_FULL_68_18]|nr:MAG: ABC transporter ATP-binding protein [Acidobacteria bacterium RIFCSPLOWO2_02_FULL_68_18]OFW48277.1 MAG: ABC transporter ATP-binding protein [Acidobacteria bacterium RIFCSPLOWO2_12_FULL_68_19]